MIDVWHSRRTLHHGQVRRFSGTPLRRYRMQQLVNQDVSVISATRTFDEVTYNGYQVYSIKRDIIESSQNLTRYFLLPIWLKPEEFSQRL